MRERPVDVTVLRDTELVRWLTRRSVTLTAHARDCLAEMLTRPQTWATTSGASSEPDLPAFADLRREVGAARRVRMLWATTGLLGGMVVAATLAINAYTTLLSG